MERLRVAARLGILIVITVSLVASGMANAGEPGAYGAKVTTDKPVYTYVDERGLTSVNFTLENTGSEVLTFEGSAPFVVKKGDAIVFQPGGLLIGWVLAPGEATWWHWEFDTNCREWTEDPGCAGVALPGQYTVEVFYGTIGSAPLQFSASATFEIVAVNPI